MRVAIGGYRIPHDGHFNFLTNTEKTLVLIGSSNVYSHRNPFSYDERRDMLLCHPDLFRNYISNKLIIHPLMDHPSDEVWAQSVRRIVELYNYENESVTLIAPSKDDSTYYKKYFSEWEQPEIPLLLHDSGIQYSSTYLRECFYNKNFDELKKFTHEKVVDYLCSNMNTLGLPLLQQ